MENAISVLVAEFKAYAGKDGSNTLSRKEFEELVKSQLKNYVKDSSDPQVIQQLMGKLDKDNDGELTFSEFWLLIGNLASEKGGFDQ